jgi:hypothetical protein
LPRSVELLWQQGEGLLEPVQRRSWMTLVFAELEDEDKALVARALLGFV